MDTMQLLIGGVIAVHGLVHLMFIRNLADPSGNPIGWTGRSRLLTNRLNDRGILGLGRALWAVAIVGFVLAGFGYLDVPVLLECWGPLAIIGSILSLLGFGLFWDGLAPKPYYYVTGPILSTILLIWVLVF